MASETERGAARIHWLVTARFSPRPRGDFFVVTPDTLEASLAARVGRVEVRVPDRLGGDRARTIAFDATRLRALTLAGVVESVPELRALLALSERPPSPEETASAVKAAIGPGVLAEACAAAGAPATAPSPATGAAAAMDAFVKGMGVSSAGPAGAARKLRDAIETAVYGTASDILAAEPIRRLEASWRALRWLLAACPVGSGIHVECLDALPEDVAGLVRARPAPDAFDEPDALFVAEPVGSAAVLGDLTDLAEEVLAPCVAAVAPGLMGGAGVADLAARAERGEPLPPEWDELRARPASRWLCAALNDVAVITEGGGAFRRTVFASPVFAVATLLSASYRASGAFAQAVGKPGAQPAPASWSIPGGDRKGTLAPTEAFLAIPAQKALAAAGVLALGSVLNSDRVVVAGAPMSASAAGAAPLPAQILTGRIVRFAKWARREIDPALPPEEVSTLFQQAAALFLFPGLEGAAGVGARVEGAAPERVLRVAARVKATHALVPLEIEFALPW
jgi:type VI secretion system protein ImpC